VTGTNWAGNVEFRAETVHHPTSVAQVQSLVARSRKVRALGSGHSFNDIADSAVLVSVASLPQAVEIDTAAATVRVAAGMSYAELAGPLHAKGYALANLASLPHVSIAGAIATATHGSGDSNGNLATAVASLELVTADGDLVTLGRDPGAVVGLGALGIVVNVTLDILPSYDIRQEVYEDLPFDAADGHFSDIVSRAYSVSLFTRWREPLIDQVWVKRVEPGEEDWFGASPAREPRHPVPGMSAAPCTRQLGVPGPWHERLPHFRPDLTPSVGEELQSEYLVPRRHAVAALRALDGIRERIAPVLQICEIRTIAADDLWMSPSHGRDTVALHFTWIKDTPAVLPVIGLIEERLAPFAPRPHWGKLFTLSHDALRSAYDRLPDFVELMGRYDPSGKFTNAFLRRHLLGD
jgi:alditol oxidase